MFQNIIQYCGGTENFLYWVFGISMTVFLFLDFVVLSSRMKTINYKSAMLQSIFWVSMASLFGILLWKLMSQEIGETKGRELGIQFFSGYLMEYSLSVDNIFVFILILNFFKVSQHNYFKVLLWGIVGAIVFRFIFIFVGIALVSKFHWVLYIFGVILIYTGYKILSGGDEQEVHPDKNIIYKFLNKRFSIVSDEGDGGFRVVRDGKKYFTILFLVVGVLASTDLVFAIDSIPAVFAISQDRMVVLTSNIFAVMGLRAMFFMLMGAVNKFHYLQEGISFVLMFIGAKMVIEIFDWHISTELSLGIIVLMLASAIILSLLRPQKTQD